MQQIELFTTPIIPPKSCAFTGHRSFYDGFSAVKLKSEIEKIISRGAEVFYNGMAIGFDLLAAETVLELKKSYPQIRLILCIPCYGQEQNFSAADKERYVSIFNRADEKIILSSHYYKGCMLARNRYMADQADALIAYCVKEKGGAAYTVKYFQKHRPDKEIIFI